MARGDPRPSELSRRGFLALAPAAAGLLLAPRAWADAPRLLGTDEASLSPFEREHLPRLWLPPLTTNGAKVPIVVEMDHPMTPEHHVTSIHVVNPRDPVPSKGTFHLTPANGRVQLSFQARLHHGRSEVTVVAECNRHGRFSSARSVEIPGDAGG